jgi:hypothetical protein
MPRESILGYITAINRREDGTPAAVYLEMNGAEVYMHPDAVIAIHEARPGCIPNIYELLLPQRAEEDDGLEGIMVTETQEGYAVDLVINIGEYRTKAEAEATAAHYRNYADIEAPIVKGGNSVRIGSMGKALSAMGCQVGDHVRVIVLRE